MLFNNELHLRGKDMKRFQISLLLVVFLFSCVENTVTKDKSDEDNVEINDSDQSEHTKAEPEDSFFQNTEPNKFIFDFKGLINNSQAVEDQKAISGIGEMTFTFGEEKIVLEGDKNLYTQKYPEGYEQPALEGKEYLLMSIYSLNDQGTLENGNSTYTYDYLSVGIPTETMLDLKESGENIIALPTLSWMTLYSYYVVMRPDSKYFMQYCQKSGSENPDSKLFVDHEANTSFSEGENFLFWGNITMSDPVEITEENRGDSCIFYDSDGNTLTKENFDEEIVKTGLDFSCEIPEGFFDSQDENYIKFKFSGEINGTDDFKSGYTEFAIMEFDGETYHADNYTSGAGTTQVISQAAIYAQMVGDYSLSNNNTAANYNDLQFFILMDELKAMKENKQNQLTFSAEDTFNFFSSFLRTKYMEIDGKGYVKSCPIALLDNESQSSEIFVCLSDENDFSPGNTFEIAARISVTDNEELVAGYYPDNGCTCYASAGDEEITCEDFDNMEE